MDKSLAIGFKNHFFRESDLLIQETLNKIGTSKKWKWTRGSWKKFCVDANKTLLPISLSQYEGGSVRKPYYAFLGLLTSDEKLFKGNEEKSLSGVISIIDYDTGMTKVRPAGFHISEHAVRRSIERSRKDPSVFQNNIFEVLSEFKYIPAWANYWKFHTFFYSLTEKDRVVLSNIEPIIPAPNGLFLAKMMPNESLDIEIRTYVDDSNLTKDQQDAKAIMIEAVTNLCNTPLNFTPVIEQLGIDHCFVLAQLLTHKLGEQIEQICKQVFYSVENDEIRSECKAKLIKFLLKHSTVIRDEIYLEFDRLGVRGAQVQVKKGLYEYYHGE